MTQETKHPFVATLGEGPFAFVGTYDIGAALAHQQAFGSTEQAFRDAPRLEAGMGTCAHCGHAILTVCIIRRGDGKLFGVGSDCVFKAAHGGDVSALSALEKQLREDAKKKRQDREARKIAEMKPRFETALEKLRTMPHPNDYFAAKGKTLADYYLYCPKNSKNMGAAIKAAGV
jgi:hypothetical protein